MGLPELYGGHATMAESLLLKTTLAFYGNVSDRCNRGCRERRYYERNNKNRGQKHAARQT